MNISLIPLKLNQLFDKLDTLSKNVDKSTPTRIVVTRVPIRRNLLDTFPAWAKNEDAYN